MKRKCFALNINKQKVFERQAKTRLIFRSIQSNAYNHHMDRRNVLNVQCKSGSRPNPGFTVLCWTSCTV